MRAGAILGLGCGWVKSAACAACHLRVHGVEEIAEHSTCSRILFIHKLVLQSMDDRYVRSLPLIENIAGVRILLERHR